MQDYIIYGTKKQVWTLPTRFDSFCKHQTTEYSTGRQIFLWEPRRAENVDQNIESPKSSIKCQNVDQNIESPKSDTKCQNDRNDMLAINS